MYKADVKEESSDNQGDPVDLGPGALTHLAKVKSEYDTIAR
jgi:hypothetical protein